MGINFEIAAPGIADEDSYINPDDLDNSLRRLANAKALCAAQKRADALTLGADTVVVKGTRVMGKPSDRDKAADMLRMLSGSSHTVITAIALVCAETGFEESATSYTTVYFRCLSEEELNKYLSLPEYKDKAGAYAIQGKAMTFVDRIEGCYYNVMGLPVTATLNLFKQFVRKEFDKNA
jgi:septum formation protein